MKRTISLIISLILIFGVVAFPAEAKIFHQCHYCGGDGKYTCDAKDCNGGKITCGRCNGSGQTTEKCAECNGTGLCRMCQGSGKRVGDETIPCDHCKGSGQCQGGPGWGPCTQGYYYNVCSDCNGDGVVWHNNEWCIYARNHGGKCPICKGTGYEGDGVEGTPNDGVSNVPHTGDGIYYLDGSYSVYGGSSSGSSSTESESSGTTFTETETDNNQEDINTNDSNELLPEDKHTTIYLGTSSVESDDFAGKTATGVIRYQDMTDEQKRAYDSLSDEELDKLLVNVRDIILTGKVGNSSEESKGPVDEFCKANNIKDFADAGILSVSFDGHIEIGFPVLVSVEVNPDFFDGSKQIHVFHIKEGGSIVQIPDEDITSVINKDGGTGLRIEFFTDSFSDFLLSDIEGLVVPADNETSNEDDSHVINDTSNWNQNAIIISVVVGIVLIATVALVFIILKKRKTHN